MATQLSSPQFVFGSDSVPPSPPWWKYGWVYLFAAIIGFSTTLAEPALIAVAFKAEEASHGTIRPWGLRLVVAAGVAAGIALGTFRIVTGASLVLFIAAGYLLVVVQTAFAPKSIIPLAYDSGGVTTSTVTVPLVAALGLGLSATIPGRMSSSPAAAHINSSTVSHAARARPPSSSRWCRKYGRSIFGMTKTHCAWATSSNTSSTSRAAVAAERLAAHDGHSSRVLHENASRCSSAHSGHRMRAKPFSKRPQSR